MRAFFAENLFTVPFVVSFLIVIIIRFLFWLKMPKPRSDFFRPANLGISFILALFFGGVILIGFVAYTFLDVEKKFANNYSEIKSNEEAAQPRIILIDSAIYENSGKPDYIGKKISVEGFKVNDTIFPSADFQKGGGMSGDNYILTTYKGKEFWILENYTLPYFEYAYNTQLETFTAKDEEENILFWERANEYGKLQEKFLGKDIRELTFNDTLILVDDLEKGLRITRKKENETYLFTVSELTRRGFSNSTIIKDLEKGYYKPKNGKTCAYYIQHGGFYRDK